MFLIYVVALVSYSGLPRRWRRDLTLGTQARLARLFLRTYGIRLPRSSFSSPTPGALVISNHTSLLDTFVLIALHRCQFITSHEMREAPGVGLLARASLCLFTERRKSRRTLDTSARELREVAQLIQNGSNVGLFPEGTTTDGTQILPFKGFYFEAARLANRSVIPLKIEWKTTGANSISPFFSGELTLGGHLWNLLRIPRLGLKLRRFPALDPMQDEPRRELCARAAKLYQEHPIRVQPIFHAGAMPR